jgi:2-polyprenyl-3-methyl-5-hydroxy-6-metoxy-1,4-benzoquinol methylase
MIELIGDVAGKRVLDVGCGDGDFAIELARRGAIVTGIDSSVEMIQGARARPAPIGGQVDFQVADAHVLPFEEGSFDIVVAMTILCFVQDARPVFNQIAHVLRPGGRLVIGELGRWSTWAVARRIRAWLGSPLWKRGRFRTAGELRRLSREAGLEPGAIRGAVYYPRCRLAARSMQYVDPGLSRLTTIGAAFIALCATKPGEQTPLQAHIPLKTSPLD